MAKPLAGLLCVSFLAGCGAPAPAFEAVADTRQLMSDILEPAAETYWDAVGTIMDSTGTTELAPSDDEEWAAVWRAALLIAESGNLLMVDGRARDRDAWTTMSRDLIATGRRAAEAAATRNPEAVFAAGGEVYQACTACHAQYAAETLRPSDARREH